MDASALRPATSRASSPIVLEPDMVSDMQALTLFGLGRLSYSRHLLCELADARRAHRWLRRVVSTVTSAGPAQADVATQVAFTADGLRLLGLTPTELGRFARSFTEGMCTPHRSRILGDIDASDPEQWVWGGPNRPVHALVAVFAGSPAALALHASEVIADLHASGAVVVRDVPTSVPDDRREHFGFVDGVSQPVLQGAPPNKRVADERWSLIEPGEFILGLTDAAGHLPPSPLLDPSADPRLILRTSSGEPQLPDFGALGGYLVVRELRQDVDAFRRVEASLGKAVTEKMVGRTHDGAALADLAAEGGNAFGYADLDPDGERCPFGAHVRRANPRDGRRGLLPELTLASTRRHRLLRRGRRFGPPFDEQPDADRGLLFACLNADIERQFEFVQHHWLNSPLFAAAGEVDPLVGAASDESTRRFTMPADPVRVRASGLEAFVTTRGGAYFFLPSIPALRYLVDRAAG